MSKSKSKQKSVINPLETLTEFAKDTIEKAAEEIPEAVVPFAPVVKEMFGNPTKAERDKGNNNFTELNFDKLQKKYDQQDADKLNDVRSQLGGNKSEINPKQQQYDYHRRVQREEEEQKLKTEAEEEEKKRQEALGEQQKKQKKEEEEIQRQQAGSMPKGKVRKTILGGEHRKATSELPPERRPDAGRQ